MAYLTDEQKIESLRRFNNMVPGVFCAECRVIAIQSGDYLCDACREDFDRKFSLTPEVR